MWIFLFFYWWWHEIYFLIFKHLSKDWVICKNHDMALPSRVATVSYCGRGRREQSLGGNSCGDKMWAFGKRTMTPWGPNMQSAEETWSSAGSQSCEQYWEDTDTSPHTSDPWDHTVSYLSYLIHFTQHNIFQLYPFVANDMINFLMGE